MKNWYKNAVVYGLDVKVYYDSDGNGFGDINGIIKKLDYISALGFNCIWLLPFYPSPLRDYGYDVQDYYNVDKRLGDLGEIAEFIVKAKELGIRVLIDLVVNHTSVKHPWFQAAKKDRNSKYRDYYIWTDKKPEEDEEKVLFEGVEESIWEYVEETDSYYLHRYYKEQADLNIPNPKVQEEILKIMHFWLRLGVAGFRIDAAHVVTDTVKVQKVDYGELHKFFKQMRQKIEEVNSEAVLLGEADVVLKEVEHYFGNNNRMHMLFNFWGNQSAFLSLARKHAGPLYETYSHKKKIEFSHWLNFIRHHDELNLNLLSNDEKQEVFEAFAPEKEMRVFNDQGIRRELPPMLNNDFARIKMFYSLTFSLPGTPLISYGEEIGMGDDLQREQRFSVRLPMQWNNEKNGGFSSAPGKKLYNRALDHGDYSYKKINVEDQLLENGSMINFTRHLIAMRKLCPEIGTADWHAPRVNDKRCFAMYFQNKEDCVVVLHNFSDEELTVNLVANFIPVKMRDVFRDRKYAEQESLKNIPLGPYGYRWLRVYERENVE